MLKFKELSKDKKAILGVRFGLYLIGFILCMFGGVNFMASIFIFFAGFLIGKYTEKIITFIKDYRLAQKVNKVSYSQIQIDNMTKELERYRNYFSSNPPPVRSTRDEECRAGGGGKVPFDYESVSYHPGEV